LLLVYPTPKFRNFAFINFLYGDLLSIPPSFYSCRWWSIMNCVVLLIKKVSIWGLDILLTSNIISKLCNVVSYIKNNSVTLKLYRDVQKVFGHCNFLLFISYKATCFQNIIPKTILEKKFERQKNLIIIFLQLFLNWIKIVYATFFPF
jgi:hypothetical protein